MDEMTLDVLDQLTAYFQDREVTEVAVHGPERLILWGGIKQECRKSPFHDREMMVEWMQVLAYESHRRLDPLHPCNGGVVPNSQLRWHAILSPPAFEQPIFCLRRHRFHRIGIDSFGGSYEVKDQIAAAMEAGQSMLLVGATASGKSSLLAALLGRYCLSERVCMIEEVPELPVLSDKWFKLCQRDQSVEGCGAVSVEFLVGEALRLRPDRLVVGEVRRDEGSALMAALLSGNGGVLTTMHAGSAPEAIARLQILDRSGLLRSNQLKTVLKNVMVVLMARGSPPKIEAIELLGD